MSNADTIIPHYIERMRSMSFAEQSDDIKQAKLESILEETNNNL
jgi:hypothetical protein